MGLEILGADQIHCDQRDAMLRGGLAGKMQRVIVFGAQITLEPMDHGTGDTHGLAFGLGLFQRVLEKLDRSRDLVAVVGQGTGIGHLARIILPEDDAIVLGLLGFTMGLPEGIGGSVAGLWFLCGCAFQAGHRGCRPFGDLRHYCAGD